MSNSLSTSTECGWFIDPPDSLYVVSFKHISPELGGAPLQFEAGEPDRFTHRFHPWHKEHQQEQDQKAPGDGPSLRFFFTNQTCSDWNHDLYMIYHAQYHWEWDMIYCRPILEDGVSKRDHQLLQSDLAVESLCLFACLLVTLKNHDAEEVLTLCAVKQLSSSGWRLRTVMTLIPMEEWSEVRRSLPSTNAAPLVIRRGVDLVPYTVVYNNFGVSPLSITVINPIVKGILWSTHVKADLKTLKTFTTLPSCG